LEKLSLLFSKAHHIRNDEMTQNNKKTKAQLLEELAALGVDAKKNMKKDELVALLDAQTSGENAPTANQVKPSAPLAGQDELADRTLDWKYEPSKDALPEAPATEVSEPAPAPAPAPEFVAETTNEPTEEVAHTPDSQPAAIETPMGQAGSDGMSGTTKLLIAVVVLAILYWIIF
jgi:hypothetical protein